MYIHTPQHQWHRTQPVESSSTSWSTNGWSLFQIHRGTITASDCWQFPSRSLPQSQIDLSTYYDQEAEAKAQTAETKSEEAITRFQEAEAKVQEAEEKVKEADPRVHELNQKLQRAEEALEKASNKAEEPNHNDNSVRP